jgi:AcrR family transcriptional regulator
MLTTVANKREKRREAIILAARKAFLRDGYAATAMSAIAADIGGSKTTLWSYFSCKQDLFIAVIDQLISEYVDSISMALNPDGTLEATLRDFGQQLLRALLTKPIVELVRLITGEAGRFPELGRLFHDRGRGRGLKIMQAYLDTAVRQGQLRDADTFYAAQHFAALCQSGCYQRHIMGGTAHPSDTEIDQDIDAAVTTFLRAYGA